MSDMTLKSLDEVVTSALDFFITTPPPQLKLEQYKFPIVVGSGNAYNTGKILFSGGSAIYANESDFKKVLERYQDLITSGAVKDAVVISASGEKDSVWEIEVAKASGLKTTLLTCSPESSAAKIADEVIAYRKLPEPYTYNFSTYLGMILSGSGEKAADLKQHLKTLELPQNFNEYESYSFILPDEFGDLAPMLDIKRHELFGPKLSLRAFTFGEARHAKFVVRDSKELVISFGVNEFFGEEASRWEIKLPTDAAYGLMMTLTYYLVGKIQNSKPDYFRQNIKRFCTDDGPKAYGSSKPFEVIVPGN